jgi:hypothetical protein
MSLVGSIPTPYIWDDRADFRDIATQILRMYTVKTETPQAFVKAGKAAREWVTSQESMMTAERMCNNIIDGVNQTFAKWKPRKSFEFIKIKNLEPKKILHPLTY